MLFSLSLFICATWLLASCSRSDTAWRERMVQIDSVAINFFPGDGTMDSVTKVMVVRDTATIDSIRKWMTAEKSSKPSKPCGPQASFHFFAMGKVMHDAEVTTSDCGLIQYRWQGQTYFNKLPGEMLRWMEAQRNGR